MRPMTKMHRWSELTTKDFVGLDPETTIAVLPVAAIEQHGPHLPVSTDTVIADGMISEVLAAAAGGPAYSGAADPEHRQIERAFAFTRHHHLVG